MSKLREFMPVALETYWSTSEVILNARNLLELWFWLLLRQTWDKSPLVLIDEGMKVNSQVYLNVL